VTVNVEVVLEEIAQAPFTAEAAPERLSTITVSPTANVWVDAPVVRTPVWFGVVPEMVTEVTPNDPESVGMIGVFSMAPRIRPMTVRVPND
jgi:hypothetical protein